MVVLAYLLSLPEGSPGRQSDVDTALRVKTRRRMAQLTLALWRSSRLFIEREFFKGSCGELFEKQRLGSLHCPWTAGAQEFWKIRRFSFSFSTASCAAKGRAPLDLLVSLSAPQL